MGPDLIYQDPSWILRPHASGWVVVAGAELDPVLPPWAVESITRCWCVSSAPIHVVASTNGHEIFAFQFTIMRRWRGRYRDATELLLGVIGA